ncbi:C1 family peptidase [Schleiferilactobacillus perolens]|jgi:bleomycin hydrolase|uniref:C1 family peptidase n=1 Tax=Schleiferilactobacillus perolens TaxID=100468 RepID=UPI002351FC08|nr:C1 family peptidase [Schleiferilactobacillus perolens]MCI2171627.1 C1 family peptidase [Schleiferilactobacillus perolens]
MSKIITAEQIANFAQQTQAQPAVSALAGAVQKNGIYAASYNHTSATALDPVFSVEINTGAVSNQKHSGRCWLFAALNMLRHEFARTHQVKDFELSQNYDSFYDRLEKANWFYEQIILSAKLPRTDRKVAKLFAAPDDDGGQWSYAVAITQKYGVVPKSVMPETTSSEATAQYSSVLNTKLRKDAIMLRQMIQDGASTAAIDAQKQKFMTAVYRITAYAFGEPPKEFTYAYRDDNQQYHTMHTTPQAFLQQEFKQNLADYACFASSPQSDKAVNTLYTVDTQGNVVGGTPVRLLNVAPDRLKALCIQLLKDNTPIWFGCDVLENMDRVAGALSGNLYNTDDLFSIHVNRDKALRLDTGQGSVSHAMTLTGVDLINDQPTKWKVENSWGDKTGHKGYFTMDDAWFDAYVYEAVIPTKYMNAAENKAWQGQPAILPAWDALS